MLTQDWPTLDVLRLRYIARVLEKNGGNKTRAADMLGIDRRTLNRILARERAKAARAAQRAAVDVRGSAGTSPAPPRAPDAAKSQVRPIAAAGAPAPAAVAAPPAAVARG